MPLLDVSFVTQDPMLADSFTVTRRNDVIDSHGRTTPTPAEIFYDQLGVVTQQDPAELMRRDDSQSVPRNIFIASMFPFRGPSQDADGEAFQPDQISWPVGPGGQELPDTTIYTVKQVFPYSRYGAGVYECVATSMNAVDPPQ